MKYFEETKTYEFINASREQVEEYAAQCRKAKADSQPIISFNDYIADLHGRPRHSVIADLKCTTLREVDLSGADLSYVNLACADLRTSDLSDTDLSHTYLYGTNLVWASLKGSSLRGANLVQANVRHADLRDADLEKADLANVNLKHADLRGANVRGADLRTANLKGADFTNADLSRANLIGVDISKTFSLSGANLTDALLYADTYNHCLSETQKSQVIIYQNQLDALAWRLINDTNLSLLDYDMPLIYEGVSDKVKAELRVAFPRLQWDKPVKEQLAAAREIFPTIQLVTGKNQEKTDQPSFADFPTELQQYILHQNAPALSATQIHALHGRAYERNVPLNSSGFVRYVLAGQEQKVIPPSITVTKDTELNTRNAFGFWQQMAKSNEADVNRGKGR